MTMQVDFAHAPPPTTVDGLRAVPIHIHDLRAAVTLDTEAEAAFAHATMTYIVGPHSGSPIFDLRQPVRTCILDGEAIDPGRIAARDVGAGPHGTVRVLDAVQGAGSAHRLTVTYELRSPAADLGGAYPPRLCWSEGTRVRWSFGMSDLYAGRYLEAWFPSNLPFDRFPFRLGLRITGTTLAHSLISNGDAALTGANSWLIRFPPFFTSMSPLVEIRPEDTVQRKSATVVLPVSRRSVAIEVWKPLSGPENPAALIARISEFLARRERSHGPLLGNRFVCLLHGASGGMEYAHAATTSVGAVGHEIFHSWFGRGVSPAAAADGWWDEAYTSFHEDGDTRTEPFDFRQPPIELCSRMPFQRAAPTASYAQGSRFFRGVAARIGPDRLRALMADLYRKYRGTSVSTADLEAHLVAGCGAVDLVDAFHRFVYGFDEPAPDPRIVFAAAPEDPSRASAVWVRRADDRFDTGEPTKPARDNWFHARVCSSADAGCCHFLVTFAVRSPAASFTYPDDFLPATAATVGFDLAPGQSRIVSARWPAALVPLPGATVSLLASVHARRAHPASGTHPWEQHSTARRDLTIDRPQRRCGDRTDPATQLR
ncbi:hypothetical protein [Nocardia xishanensis]|uniref:Peptidase M1 membrane alanine aminopeptidase domain-containing protein n=1 Tax=Nocardia xishanensis TaxID=238964 RepID=A0ABW7XAD9_9NOCA